MTTEEAQRLRTRERELVEKAEQWAKELERIASRLRRLRGEPEPLNDDGPFPDMVINHNVWGMDPRDRPSIENIEQLTRELRDVRHKIADG